MNIRKKKILKLKVGILIFFLGFLLSCVAVKAASNNIDDYITEINIEGETWLWGDPKLEIQLASGEPIYTKYTLHFTKNEWHALDDAGGITLQFDMSEGQSVTPSSNSIATKIDDVEHTIGSIDVADSEVVISIYDQYREYVEKSTDIEIFLGLILKFADGDYKINDKINVTASEKADSILRWNSKSIIVNKIDSEDDTKLLENARFEIDEYEYSQEENKYIYKSVYQLTPDTVEENGSFILKEGGFSTIKDTPAVITGGFEAGNLYHLKEIIPPVGYLPWKEPIKVGFYRYTEDKDSGTVKRLQDFNSTYKTQYENEGAVAIFGAEQAYGELEAPNIYVRNQKSPKLQIIKLNADTNKVMADVEFTLQIQADQTGYQAEEYLNLENSKWTYDSAADLLKWTEKTDKDGIISYPEGTVPYSATMYELVEKVPEGYEGYGGTKTTRFQAKMKEDGTLEVVSDTGLVDCVDGINTIKILNQPVGDICILKVDESGKPLKGAEFVIYGTSEKNTDDTIEKMGKKYYKLQEATTEKGGTAIFTGLPYGEYYLVEKKAPQGYKILKDSHKIEIDKDILKDGVYTVKITNKKQGTPIIDTGGKGIFKNIIIGVFLFIVGSFLFLVGLRYEKKRRRAKRRAAARRRANGQPPQRQRSPQRKKRR